MPGKVGGLTFQVGTTSSDSIDVQIQGTKGRDLYLDENNNFKDITIDTQTNANDANTILELGMNRVISTSATVGSLQSRFDFAAANINSSIQNQDAARSTFLDTDISAESTMFAQAQVRLQASISTLAQANQIQQSLLKLINGQ